MRAIAIRLPMSPARTALAALFGAVFITCMVVAMVLLARVN